MTDKEIALKLTEITFIAAGILGNSGDKRNADDLVKVVFEDMLNYVKDYHGHCKCNKQRD